MHEHAPAPHCTQHRDPEQCRRWHGINRLRRHRSLAQQLALRDLNYLRLQRLLEAGGAGRRRFSLAAQYRGSVELRLHLSLAPLPKGPYTESYRCALIRDADSAAPPPPLSLALHIYHDLKSVEVVRYGGHEGKGGQRVEEECLSAEEKWKLDGIFGEWLSYFLDRGHYHPLASQHIPARFPIDDNCTQSSPQALC